MLDWLERSDWLAYWAFTRLDIRPTLGLAYRRWWPPGSAHKADGTKRNPTSRELRVAVWWFAYRPYLP